MSSRLRRSSAVLMILGLLFIALAAVTHFVITPALTKLPADTDSTAHYSGTATLLNSRALAAGDAANALAKDVPITIDRHVFVTGTDGDTATVQEESTLNVPGSEAAPKTHVYEIDRSDLVATAAIAEDGSATPIGGLVFTLPLHPKAQDYAIYDANTAQSVPLTYTGTGTVGDRDVNTYTFTATGPLQDQATLQGLPPALPKALIGKILPMLPPASQQALNASLSTLPDTVPLAYTVSSEATLQADQTLGAPLASSSHQTIVANVRAGDAQIPLIPVVDVEAQVTDETIAANVATAAEKAKSLNLISVQIPAALALTGALLVVVGFVRRKPKIDTGAAQPTGDGSFARVS